MKKIILIFLVIIIVKNNLIAQFDDPYQYYPMATGNYWYYSAGPAIIHWQKVVSDSTDNKGNRYFLLQGSYSLNYCIDTESYLIENPLSPNRNKLYKLNATLGEKWWIRKDGEDTTNGMWGQVEEVITGIYLAKTTKLKKYVVYGRQKRNDRIIDTYYYHVVLAYGIGMIYKDNDANYPDVLTGAIINGQIIGNPVGIEEKAEILPSSFELYQNYPNPFNPTTTIKYRLPKKSQISINVFNSLGERVKTLYEGRKREGECLVEFNGTGLPSGVYFIQLVSENVKKTIKALLIK